MENWHDTLLMWDSTSLQKTVKLQMHVHAIALDYC